jgi:DNA-directed RNA polymerase specialized sigma24 family protein
MHTPLCPQGPGQVAGALHAAFLALLPRIERHARICFRHLGCPQRRDDAVAETVALCWQWYLRLVERGKDPAAFVSTFAGYAARAVRRGRRVCGQEAGQEVLSPRAQARHGFAVLRLPAGPTTLNGSPLEEALLDNAVTPPPEAAAFRIDFPAWLASWPERDRRLIEALGLGERTLALAQQRGLTPGRISQKRREYHGDWLRFCGDLPVDQPTQGAAGAG